MKLILSGVTTIAGLVWYLNGGSGGPDASRDVSKAPEQVYSEIAPLFPAGRTEVSGAGRDGVQRQITVDIKKSPDRSIAYKMTLDGAEVMKMDLHFDPAGSGSATKLSGNLDVDQALVRFAASQSGTEARHLPASTVNIAMEQMVDRMGDAIEAGQPVTRDMLFPLMKLSS